MQQDSTSISTLSFTELVSAYWELTKPGITTLVMISMIIGFFLGSYTVGFDFITFIHVSIGTFLTASGTSAFNQFIERDLDKLMKRTSKRPLPTHKVSATNAFAFSTGLIFTGLAFLVIKVNPIAASVSLATSILYLGFYTPLKRVSFLNVFVGSIPGALPPVGGWAAATGNVTDVGMWLLFAIVFLWQIPHVIAIAWLCSEDYSNAGFVMLPKKDTSGSVSSYVSLISALLLIPITYMMFSFHISGMLFLIGGLIAAIMFVWYAILHLRERTKVSAKKLMFASLLYLPIAWCLVVFDRVFGF